MKYKVTPRNLLGFIILALIVTLAVTVFNNYRGAGPEEILETLPKDVDISLQKLDYTETRNGIRSWSLIADSAAYNVKTETTSIGNVSMTFYDEKGREEGELTAQNGEVHTDNKHVTVWGDVRVKNQRGYSLYTERLDYVETTRTISTDAPIRMVSEKMELTGRGLRFNVDNYSYYIPAGVKARLQGEHKR